MNRLLIWITKVSSLTFDSYLHDAQRATEEGAPLVASELYDLLIAFIDDYNKELFEQQHPDKASEYNPAIGLEMKRIELLSSAAVQFPAGFASRSTAADFEYPRDF